MTFESYEIQVLVAVGKACKPNSPKPERAWTKVMPLYGIPEFGDALSKLRRAGLLLCKHGFKVQPSPTGYRVIARCKIYRREMKRRPVLFNRCIWDQPIRLEMEKAA